MTRKCWKSIPGRGGGKGKTRAWHVLPRRCDVKVCYFGRAGKRRNGSEEKPRLVSGSGSDFRLSMTTAAKSPSLPPRSGYCASRLSTVVYTICLFAYQSTRKLLEKGNLIGKQARCREEDSTMSPPSDDSDPDPLSLFPLQSLDVSCAGNINHNSRTDPTELCNSVR